MPLPRPINPSYTLGVLTIASTLSYLDRQILGLLAEPLRQDLHLTDLQIGLLQGFTFAIVLATAGLPLGRWVDTGNRVRIAAVGIALWSIMTAACGFAGSFGALLLCRTGVALGEAALTPAAYSLISDLFPTRRRGLAISIYSTGAFIGAGLSLVLAATVLHELSSAGNVFVLPGMQHIWQMVFVFIGLPGIAVALWAASLKEPRKHSGATPGPIAGTVEIRAYFLDNRVELASLYFCLAFAATQAYSYSSWVPTVLIRTFHMPPIAVGFSLGPLFIASSVSGLIFGAILGDGLVRRGFAAARPILMCGAALIAALFTAAMPFASTLNAACPDSHRNIPIHNHCCERSSRTSGHHTVPHAWHFKRSRHPDCDACRYGRRPHIGRVSQPGYAWGSEQDRRRTQRRIDCRSYRLVGFGAGSHLQLQA